MSSAKENNKNKYGRKKLERLVLNATKTIADNKFLDILEKGKLSKDNWIKFAVERYRTATVFEELLHVLIAKAREVGDKKLLDALEWNLRDEVGMDETGRINKELAHDT